MENLIQTRVKDFESEILPFKAFIANTQLKELIDFSDTFLDGFRTLGVGELYARQNERQSKLTKLAAHAKFSQEMFKSFNESGIQRINDALDKLKKTAEVCSTAIKPNEIKNFKKELKEEIDQFKFQCTELEIKGRDVEKLFNAVDSLSEGLQKDGIPGVFQIMEKNLRELISLRKSDNRGAIDNFPVWKVAALIVGIGVWIVAFIHCGIFGCSAAAGTAYFIIFLIAAIVSKFC